MTVLEAEVIKATGGHITPSFVRLALQRAARIPEIAARMPEGTSTVAVRITDDEEMLRLNRAYAGEDHAADVLSFEGSGDHLGDIAISWPAVLRQSRQIGYDSWTELMVLAVHGLLHLLGWNHETDAEYREMARLTKAVLRRTHLVVPPRRFR